MPENNEQPAAPAEPIAPVTPETPVAPAPAPAAPVAPAAPAPAAAPVAPVAPKQPMDPAKKKKIILFSCIGGGVLILGIAAAIIIPMLLKVNYGEAYDLAGEIYTALSANSTTGDCYNAHYYVDYSYRSESSYEEDLNTCRESLATSANTNLAEAIEKLGNSRAVTSNPAVKAQYDKFYAEYKKTPIDDAASMVARLDLYKAWHTFWVKRYNLSRRETDANIAAAAASLVNSNDETLKAYGEGWITKRIAYSRAYGNWYDTPGYTNEYSEAKATAETELEEYEEQNEPAFVKAANEATSGNSTVRTEFRTLYEQIADMYELNYDWGSGKCTEMQMLNIVYCDIK